MYLCGFERGRDSSLMSSLRSSYNQYLNLPACKNDVDIYLSLEVLSQLTYLVKGREGTQMIHVSNLLSTGGF